MKNYFLFLILFIPFFICGCSSSAKFSKDDNKSTQKPVSNSDISIKVLLTENPASIDYIVKEPVRFTNEKNSVGYLPEGSVIRIIKDRETVKTIINGRSYEGKYFQLMPRNKKQTIYFNGNDYKGHLIFSSLENSVKLVNILPLDEYLKSVVASEMPADNKNYLEGLKAFAICARTYAVSKMNSNTGEFNIYADTRDQVYNGSGVENELANTAVEQTKNQILIFDGKPASTFYYSTCGGVTEDVSNIFGTKNTPYLRSITDGEPSFCRISPAFKWTETYRPETIIKFLTDADLLENNDCKLIDIEIVDRFESGRVKELEVLVKNEDNVQSIKLYGNNIRQIIKRTDGENNLRSILFDIEKDDNMNIKILGKGYGHGVGLCQWGALAQSLQGIKYPAILSHYYPGTKIEFYK